MKIHYLNCDGKLKLFSFHRHDYQSREIDGKFYMLDGGFDYNRFSGGTIEEDEIKDLIEDIREQFYWTKNYNEKNERIPSERKLLKDLSSSHICGILSYFTNKLSDKIDISEGGFACVDKSWCSTHQIFIEELDFRIKNSLI